MKIFLISLLTVFVIFGINLILYKLGDIFSWHFLPKQISDISDKQYHFFLFSKKPLDSEEFTDVMEKTWKNTDLKVFRKLLDI